MANDAQVKAAAVREFLAPIRAKLDQLTQQAEDEGVRISRETVEALLGEKAVLELLLEEAENINNQRLIAEVAKERYRALQGLGLRPRKAPR